MLCVVKLEIVLLHLGPHCREVYYVLISDGSRSFIWNLSLIDKHCMSLLIQS